MKKEIQIFFTALMFYTRIPVPKSVGYSADNLNRSTKYFTFIGIIVGSFGALAYLLSANILPHYIAVLIGLVSTIMITGAFHEDAFADFCDGFGGGYSKVRMLEIMKDSSIGTYGSLGLMFMILLRFIGVSEINPQSIPITLIAAHSFSRMLPFVFIYTDEYVSDSLTSKSKHIALKSPWHDLVIAMIIALIPMLFVPLKFTLLVIPVSVILFFIFRAYVLKQIGGYTGDVLGALQQLSELVFYICFIIVQNNA